MDTVAEQRLRYFVNGEEQTAEDPFRTVSQILELAGFLPVHEYELTRDSDGHTFERYDERVELHEGERFTATYIGPTPVS